MARYSKRMKTYGKSGCAECKYKIELPLDEECLAFGIKINWECGKYKNFVGQMNVGAYRQLSVRETTGRMCMHWMPLPTLPDQQEAVAPKQSQVCYCAYDYKNKKWVVHPACKVHKGQGDATSRKNVEGVVRKPSTRLTSPASFPLPDQCPESYKQYYCDVCGQSTPTAYSRCQECVEAGKTPSSKLADWQDRKDGTVFQSAQAGKGNYEML